MHKPTYTIDNAVAMYILPRKTHTNTPNAPFITFVSTVPTNSPQNNFINTSEHLVLPYINVFCMFYF